MPKSKLIVGLGNPGLKYDKTRHNLGFLVVREYAKRHGFSFKKVSHVQGELATGKIDEETVFLLLPHTFMNLSGQSVRSSIEYYKIAVEDILVVLDEVYLKFGTLRLRSAGSSGGHNGLKSIEEHLKTQNYARLRMGIGPEKNEDFPDRKNMTLEEYVLAEYTSSEKEALEPFVAKGADAIEEWIRT